MQSTSNARHRKAAKRALCPLINKRLMEAAESGKVASLLAIVSQHLPEMNLVNLTTALHRIAKMKTEHPNAAEILAQDRHQRLLSDLLATTSQALRLSDPGLNASRRQALSILVWSLATLERVHLELIQIAVSLTEGRLHELKPFELASTLWAFARLGQLSPAAKHMSAGVFCTSGQSIVAAMDQLGFRFLTMVAWALAVTGNADADLFGRMASRLLSMIRRAEVKPDLLLELSTAFGSKGVRHENLLLEVAWVASNRGALESFDCRSLAQLCEVMISEGVFCGQLVLRCARLAEVGTMQPHDLASVVVAVSNGRSLNSAAASSVSILAPACTNLVQSFDSNTLASVAWGIALTVKSQAGSRDTFSSQRAMSQEVTTFFQAVLPVALRRVTNCSGAALVRFAATFSRISLSAMAEQQLHQAIASRLMSCPSLLDPAGMALFFANVPSSPNGAYEAVWSYLCSEAANQIDSFMDEDVRCIDDVCLARLNMPTDQTSGFTRHRYEVATRLRYLGQQQQQQQQQQQGSTAATQQQQQQQQQQQSNLGGNWRQQQQHQQQQQQNSQQQQNQQQPVLLLNQQSSIQQSQQPIQLQQQQPGNSQQRHFQSQEGIPFTPPSSYQTMNNSNNNINNNMNNTSSNNMNSNRLNDNNNNINNGNGNGPIEYYVAVPAQPMGYQSQGSVASFQQQMPQTPQVQPMLQSQHSMDLQMPQQYQQSQQLQQQQMLQQPYQQQYQQQQQQQNQYDQVQQNSNGNSNKGQRQAQSQMRTQDFEHGQHQQQQMQQKSRQQQQQQFLQQFQLQQNQNQSTMMESSYMQQNRNSNINNNNMMSGQFVNPNNNNNNNNVQIIPNVSQSQQWFLAMENRSGAWAQVSDDTRNAGCSPGSLTGGQDSVDRSSNNSTDGTEQWIPQMDDCGRSTWANGAAPPYVKEDQYFLPGRNPSGMAHPGVHC